MEADGGTLFLDEVGDMPSELQSKLLRVLEDREIRPVGADQTRLIDVRVVAATHRNLEELVVEGSFREDLYFRLNVLPIEVPPLRTRDGDIPLLVEHFVTRARGEHPTARVERFSAEAIELLEQLSWPGNVRQLANLVRRLVVLTDGDTVEADDVEAEFDARCREVFEVRRPSDELIPLKEVEDRYIDWVIEQCDGNKTRAAAILGIDPSTIHRRRKRK